MHFNPSVHVKENEKQFKIKSNVEIEKRDWIVSLFDKLI